MMVMMMMMMMMVMMVMMVMMMMMVMMVMMTTMVTVMSHCGGGNHPGNDDARCPFFHQVDGDSQTARTGIKIQN